MKHKWKVTFSAQLSISVQKNKNKIQTWFSSVLSWNDPVWILNFDLFSFKKVNYSNTQKIFLNGNNKNISIDDKYIFWLFFST